MALGGACWGGALQVAWRLGHGAAAGGLGGVRPLQRAGVGWRGDQRISGVGEEGDTDNQVQEHNKYPTKAS